jgi:hypothetical protein
VDLDRRRLLAAGSAGLVALAAGGTAVARLLRSDDPDEASLRTATSSTSSSTSTSSSSSTSTTTEAPSTTESPATTARSTPSTDPASPPAAPGSGRLEILCRASWGAAAPRGTLPRHTIDELTVHHTAAVLSDNRKAPRRVRSFQQGHLDDGFVDLAYHYVIDAHGNVYEARSTDIPGETYTDYDPRGHFLAVCDGNFEEQPIPAAQLEALALLLAWASARFGVPTTRLRGHRDEAATACPGEHLYAHLRDGSLKAAIDRHLAAGAPSAVVLCGSDGAARVAAIEAGSA